MSTKNIYELLNETALDLSDYKKEDLNKMEKKRIKKAVLKTTRNGSRRTKPAVAAAAILVLCLSIGMVYRSNAYAFVKELQYKLGMFISPENLDPFIQVIDKTVSDKNVSVTLNEIVMDNDELVITSTISITEAEKDIKGILVSEDLMIDGKLINNGASGAAKQVDKNTFESYMVYSISGYDINPEEIHNINYTIKNVFYHEQEAYKEITGKWAFKFTAEGGELLSETRSVPLNETILLPDGGGITINQYTSNALGQKMYFDILQPGGIEYLVELRGTDDKGNDVVFYISHINQTSGLFKIDSLKNGYIQDNAQTLTLTPYYVEKPKESGKINNQYIPIDMKITLSLN